jgi:peptide deformylase
MAQLEIFTYDDPVLRETARPITAVQPRHRQLGRDMAESMYASRGIGLAANQVGLTERIIVVDVDWPKSEDRRDGPAYQPRVLVNPEVLEAGDEDDPYVEGCLSLPGIEGEVWRPTRIRYRYLDLEGKPVEAEAQGLLARCIQHEVDHLNGILFIDRMEAEERERLAGKLAKLRRTRKQAVS